MKLLLTLFSCLLLCLCACNKEKINERAGVDCSLITNAQIIPEDEIPCNYTAVYRYEGEIYTHCVCCACLKWQPPMNCNGEILCQHPQGCWEEFQEKAEYLFAIRGF